MGAGRCADCGDVLLSTNLGILSRLRRHKWLLPEIEEFSRFQWCGDEQDADREFVLLSLAGKCSKLLQNFTLTPTMSNNLAAGLLLAGRGEFEEFSRTFLFCPQTLASIYQLAHDTEVKEPL